MLRWGLTFILAFFLVLVDYALFWNAEIPIVGDAVDIAALALMVPLTGKYALLNLVELIPFADVLPTNLFLTWLAYMETLGPSFKLKE